LSINSPRGHTSLTIPSARTLLLTTLTILAFAGNSVLCRIALRETGIAARRPGGQLDLGADADGGVAWGVYSIRGKGAGDATRVTAGNFLRAVPFAVVLSLLPLAEARLDAAGGAYALASGAITSGLGYAIWYTVLPHLKATSGATVQLSVPVIAALGGIALVILRAPSRGG
jgi:drug/metabolite transporter (DMT)-like permease